jgi:hypothetical protein
LKLRLTLKYATSINHPKEFNSLILSYNFIALNYYDANTVLSHQGPTYEAPYGLPTAKKMERTLAPVLHTKPGCISNRVLHYIFQKNILLYHYFF